MTPEASQPGNIWASVGKPITGLAPGKYRLTSEYLYFETGGLSTNAQQIPTSYIVDVDLRQSMTQKARKVGSVAVHIDRNGNREVALINDISDFREAVDIINRVARTARENLMRAQRTQHVNYAGSAPVPAAPPVASSNPEREGLIAQMRGLGDMHFRKVIGDEQFISEVHKILPRL